MHLYRLTIPNLEHIIQKLSNATDKKQIELCAAARNELNRRISLRKKAS